MQNSPWLQLLKRKTTACEQIHKQQVKEGEERERERKIEKKPANEEMLMNIKHKWKSRKIAQKMKMFWLP